MRKTSEEYYTQRMPVRTPVIAAHHAQPAQGGRSPASPAAQRIGGDVRQRVSWPGGAPRVEVHTVVAAHEGALRHVATRAHGQPVRMVGMQQHADCLPAPGHQDEGVTC